MQSLQTAAGVFPCERHVDKYSEAEKNRTETGCESMSSELKNQQKKKKMKKLRVKKKKNSTKLLHPATWIHM